MKPKNKPRMVAFNVKNEGIKFERKKMNTNVNAFECLYDTLLLNNKNSTNIYRESIKNIDSNAVFFIRNFLNKNECNAIINASETCGLFEQRKFAEGNRNSHSCCFQSNNISDILYQRISKYLNNVSYFDCHSSLSLNEYHKYVNNQIIQQHGTLYCLNNNIRIEKYYNNQYLKIHRDGTVKINRDNYDNIYTIYAIIVYLNENYNDGYTQFVKDKEYNPKTNELFDYCNIRGNIGDALCFRHELLHSGGNVTNGTKYILRLDAAYKTM